MNSGVSAGRILQGKSETYGDGSDRRNDRREDEEDEILLELHNDCWEPKAGAVFASVVESEFREGSLGAVRRARAERLEDSGAASLRFIPLTGPPRDPDTLTSKIRTGVASTPTMLGDE